MSKDYPHLSDTRFPDLDTANPYKYRNEFDYDRYEETTKIKMLNVSWCGDYDNVVYFETKQLRDQWFEAQAGLVKEMSTMFRLYTDGSIKVEVPIDECMDYNYLMIDYAKLPQQGQYSDQRRMFYFINECVQESPNTTTLELTVDYWTTFINDMDISYVNLARGHAPMAATTAESYLANPIENSEYLLTSDVNYGDFQRIASTSTNIINDDIDNQYLCFASNGFVHAPEDVQPDNRIAWFGKVDTLPYYEEQAMSSILSYAIKLEDWATFRDTISAECPQFFQTVKAMFVAPGKCLSFRRETDFFGITMWRLATSGTVNLGEFNITKDKFGFADNISSIAKLYTHPYSAIEVNDFKGNTSIIKIEDTSGKLTFNSIMNDMYPFINIEGYLTGIGNNQRITLSFANATSDTFTIGGRDYNFSTKWSIPVFSVQLTADNDWSLNGAIGADAAKNNAIDGADASNKRSRNAVANARDNMLVNNEYIQDVNDRIAGDDGHYWTVEGNQVTKLKNDRDSDKSAMRAASYLQAGSAAATTFLNSAETAVMGGAMSGNVGFAAAGAVAGTTSAIVTLAMNPEIISANEATINAKTANTLAYLVDSTIENVSLDNDKCIMTKDNNTYINNNDTAIGNTNADISKAVVVGGSVGGGVLHSGTDYSGAEYQGTANRTWNASHAQKLISNHPQFGQLTGTPEAINRPMGIRYNVITQSKNAIRQAAEQFLRYGYALNMEWNITSFNLMSKFTYWQCNVVYCDDDGVYEGAQSMIKSILTAGTTVWRLPEEIGLVSIYQNEVA